MLSLGDKVLHGLMYMALAMAWMAPTGKRKPLLKPSVLVVLGVTLYGALMEVLQRFCTLTRSGELADVIANFAGSTVGVVIIVLICILLRHH